MLHVLAPREVDRRGSEHAHLAHGYEVLHGQRSVVHCPLHIRLPGFRALARAGETRAHVKAVLAWEGGLGELASLGLNVLADLWYVELRAPGVGVVAVLGHVPHVEEAPPGFLELESIVADDPDSRDKVAREALGELQVGRKVPCPNRLVPRLGGSLFLSHQSPSLVTRVDVFRSVPSVLALCCEHAVHVVDDPVAGAVDQVVEIAVLLGLAVEAPVVTAE